MKLNENFVTHETDGTAVLISMDSKVFSGLIKLNRTASFIVDCLKSDTNIEEIADKLTSKYNVDRATAEKDIGSIVSQLRSVGAIDDD